MLIAGRHVEGIGLGTAQFAFRDGTAEDSVATVHAALDAGVQNRLSYTDPADLPTARECSKRDVAYLAYMPFGGPSGSLPEAARAVASKRGVSAHRVVLAWLGDQSPNILPLAGASRPQSIRDSATRLDLDDQDRKELARHVSWPHP